AEARQAAGMRYHYVEEAALTYAEPVSVAARAQRDGAGLRVAYGARALVAYHLLHLAPRCAIQRTVVRAVARRPRVEHEAHPARQVGDGREHPAHGAERAVGELILLEPFIVLPAVAVRQTRGIHLGALQGGGSHTERLQHVL